jgi:hypothetical protein
MARPSYSTFVNSGVAGAVLAAQIRNRNAGLVLVQNSDDLLFRKAIVPDALVLVVGKNQTSNWTTPVGKVRRREGPQSGVNTIFQSISKLTSIC